MEPADISETPQPHVLLLPWPALGHINPIMNLATFLSAAGVAATLVNTHFYHRRLVRSLKHKTATRSAVPNAIGNSNGSVTQIPDVLQLDELLGEDLYLDGCGEREVAPIRLIGIPDGVNDEDYIVMDFLKISEGLFRSIDRVVEITQSLSPPLTSVIGDVFTIWTAAVGERLAIPHLGLWTQSAASFAAHVVFTHNPTHFKELMTMDVVDMESRHIVGIPGCPALKPTEVVTFLQSCDMSDFFFKHLTWGFNVVIPKHSHLLLNTFEELEPEALAFVKGFRTNVMEIGPMISTMKYVSGGGGGTIMERKDGRGISLWEEDETCVEWLDLQAASSVLYVSFGSLALLSEAELCELAAGLEASGCRILMVARKALVHGKDTVFPNSFAMSEKVRFVEWAPQLAVLAHPSVGGFLTHAGWNSTTESISNGVPMLCWPFVADQMMNCRGIVDYWRIGLDLHRDPSSGLVQRKEIESKVQRLMDPASSKDIRKRAFELSIQARECRRNSSEANLQSLLHSIGNNVSVG